MTPQQSLYQFAYGAQSSIPSSYSALSSALVTSSPRFLSSNGGSCNGGISIEPTLFTLPNEKAMDQPRDQSPESLQRQQLALQHQQHQAQIQIQYLQLQQGDHQSVEQQQKRAMPLRHQSFSGPTSSLSFPFQNSSIPAQSATQSTQLRPLEPIQITTLFDPQNHQLVTPSSSSFSFSTLSQNSADALPVSSMGVLSMPSFPHSHHPHSQYTLSHTNQQDQNHCHVHPHQVRHNSLPDLDQAYHRFQPAHQHHQQQQQQETQLQHDKRRHDRNMNTSSLFYHHVPSVQQGTLAQHAHPTSTNHEPHQPQQAAVTPQNNTMSSSALFSSTSHLPMSGHAHGANALCSTSLSSDMDSSHGNDSNNNGCLPWPKTDGLPNHRSLAMSSMGSRPSETDDEIIRRFSYSSTASDMNPRSAITMDEHNPLSSYTLEARIIQKKDQLEELSSTGSVLVTPVVKEVRTGQQFLIKLHLTKNGSSLNSNIPSLRVGRRVAINTAGDPRSDPEPLTLEIGISLAKSGQIRKGACAKCCHKYGPSSPILLLLDPLSPSITDPSNYAHIDTATGSITMLAKVVCSSTDHGERGNKDRYLFEFKLKRTSSMSPSSIEPLEDDGETIASCFIPPVMCSGHHKAKRVYPHQRPSKITKGTPTPKTKTIKRQRITSNSAILCNVTPHGGEHPDGYINAEPVSNVSGFQASMAFLPDHLPRAPVVEPYSDVPNEPDRVDHTRSSHSLPHMPPTQHPSGPVPPARPQCPRITEVRPDHGPIRKTTDVVLRGAFFHEGMVPYFGCFPAEDIVVETATLILCKAPKSPLPGTVSITIHDNIGNSFAELGQFTYLDDSETELLILQLQLRLAHRALEYLHVQATGRKGNAVDILKGIPGLVSSPHSASLLMDNMDPDSAMDADQPMMSLPQVEQGILNTLDHLPQAIDISEQLEDGSSLLHLGILLGFDRLATRLVEEGCELELMDAWLMTPLMYAVLKGNEVVARALVNAGTSSTGAETPREFCDRLPFETHITLAMDKYLSISCTRFWNEDSVYPSADTEEESDTMEVGSDEEEERLSFDTFDEEQHRDRHIAWPPTPSTAPETPVVMNPHSEAQSDGSELMAQLADTIQGVRINHGIPPLDQQRLPPLHTVETDGTITINTSVVQGIELAESLLLGNNMYRNVNPESGYHSGVYTEVRERLSLLNKATLPHEGLKMTVLMKKLSASNPSPTSTRPISISSAPRELFRTGDSFKIEIRLSTIDPSSTNDKRLPLPKEFIGVKFPHNMVKRVGGRPAVLLSEMTYILKVTIELGQSSADACTGSCITADTESRNTDASQGDGIPLSGPCQACSKFLHEHRNLPPSPNTTSDPSLYPILQLSIPGGLPSTTSSHQEPISNQDTNSSGVVELRDGLCEVKAKVNCSSLHQLHQRDRIRSTEELRLQQQGLSSPSSSSSSYAVSPTGSAGSTPDSSTKTATLAKSDIQDLGYVFKFELIHPSLNTAVAYYETNPIMFQSYARGRT